MMQSMMPLQINHGLFKLNFPDHYAVLGLPIGADEKQVRKRYLQIARQLHPDRCQAKNDVEQDYASKILSELVNPAYQNLYKKNLRVEYQLLLQQMGQRLAKEEDKITLATESAKKLAQAGSKAESLYKKVLQVLAAEEYQSLEKTVTIIAQISELNAIYLKITAGEARKSTKSPVKNAVSVTNKSQIDNTKAQPAASPQTTVDSYLRRAQEYIDKNIFAKARIEIEDALKIDPNNSSCNALKGLIYLKQNQLTSARIFINKAHQADPTAPIIIKCKQELDKQESKTNKRREGDKSSTAKSKSRGMFGGLFGGKKK
ncbi:MAG: J domain-containing protein [Prochloraceae cyanobacterium]|nr:J domain-containing protein [Prochloraceae cyanobacterium]